MIGGAIVPHSYVYFVALSESLPLSELTRAMGSFPDEGWSAGDRHELMGGVRTRKFTSWRVFPADLTAGVDEQLEMLMSRVEATARFFTPKPQVETALSIIDKFDTQGRHPRIELSEDWVSLLADMNAALNIDQYPEDDSPEDPPTPLAHSEIQLFAESRSLSLAELEKRIGVQSHSSRQNDIGDRRCVVGTIGHLSTMEQFEQLAPSVASIVDKFAADDEIQWNLMFTQHPGAYRSTTVGIYLDEGWIEWLARLRARVTVA